MPDGKLLLVWGGQLGVARVVDGVVCYGMARLNSDGSLDSTFLFSADTFANAEAPAYAAAKSFSNANLLPNAVLTSDGKIYLSLDWGRRPPGVFGQAGSIHRLLPDGELDTSFRSNHDTHYERQLAPQKDGRLLVLETLRWGWDSPQPSTLKRLNADGTLDRTFNSSELERSFEVGYVQITAIALTTGANYTLQSSEDLIHWEDGLSFNADSDQYTIGAWTRSVIKFYRLVGQP